METPNLIPNLNRVFPEGEEGKTYFPEVFEDGKDPMVKYQIAIDPGNLETAIVVVDFQKKTILETAKLPNEQVVEKIQEYKQKYGWCQQTGFAIEMIASYGMPVGKSVFDTCLWIGRYAQIWGKHTRLITRSMVKNHICKSPKANDANIRQALMDRYGSTREAAIGTKKNPGPLFGVGNDERAALAVALTAIETDLKYITSGEEDA